MMIKMSSNKLFGQSRLICRRKTNKIVILLLLQAALLLFLKLSCILCAIDTALDTSNYFTNIRNNTGPLRAQQYSSIKTTDDQHKRGPSYNNDGRRLLYDLSDGKFENFNNKKNKSLSSVRSDDELESNEKQRRRRQQHYLSPTYNVTRLSLSESDQIRELTPRGQIQPFKQLKKDRKSIKLKSGESSLMDIEPLSQLKPANEENLIRGLENEIVQQPTNGGQIERDYLRQRRVNKTRRLSDEEELDTVDALIEMLAFANKRLARQRDQISAMAQQDGGFKAHDGADDQLISEKNTTTGLIKSRSIDQHFESVDLTPHNSRKSPSATLVTVKIEQPLTKPLNSGDFLPSIKATNDRSANESYFSANSPLKRKRSKNKRKKSKQTATTVSNLSNHLEDDKATFKHRPRPADKGREMSNATDSLNSNTLQDLGLRRHTRGESLVESRSQNYNRDHDLVRPGFNTKSDRHLESMEARSQELVVGQHLQYPIANTANGFPLAAVLANGASGHSGGALGGHHQSSLSPYEAPPPPPVGSGESTIDLELMRGHRPVMANDLLSTNNREESHGHPESNWHETHSPEAELMLHQARPQTLEGLHPLLVGQQPAMSGPIYESRLNRLPPSYMARQGHLALDRGPHFQQQQGLFGPATEPPESGTGDPTIQLQPAQIGDEYGNQLNEQSQVGPFGHQVGADPLKQLLMAAKNQQEAAQAYERRRLGYELEMRRRNELMRRQHEANLASQRQQASQKSNGLGEGDLRPNERPLHSEGNTDHNEGGQRSGPSENRANNANEQPSNQADEADQGGGDTQQDSNQSENNNSDPKQPDEDMKNFQNSFDTDFTDLFPPGVLSKAEINEMRRQHAEQKQKQAEEEQQDEEEQERGQQQQPGEEEQQQQEDPKSQTNRGETSGEENQQQQQHQEPQKPAANEPSTGVINATSANGHGQSSGIQTEPLRQQQQAGASIINANNSVSPPRETSPSARLTHHQMEPNLPSFLFRNATTLSNQAINATSRSEAPTSTPINPLLATNGAAGGSTNVGQSALRSIPSALQMLDSEYQDRYLRPYLVAQAASAKQRRELAKGSKPTDQGQIDADPSTAQQIMPQLTTTTHRSSLVSDRQMAQGVRELKVTDYKRAQDGQQVVGNFNDATRGSNYYGAPRMGSRSIDPSLASDGAQLIDFDDSEEEDKPRLDAATEPISSVIDASQSIGSMSELDELFQMASLSQRLQSN